MDRRGGAAGDGRGRAVLPPPTRAHPHGGDGAARDPDGLPGSREPIGIAHVRELTGQAVNLDALRRVRFLVFLGDADTNHSVPCEDSFSAEDRDLINRRFGKCGLTCGKPAETLVKRWWPAQRLYHTAGVKRAQLKLYHGMSHEVTPVMWNDVLHTFPKGNRRALIRKSGGPQCRRPPTNDSAVPRSRATRINDMRGCSLIPPPSPS